MYEIRVIQSGPIFNGDFERAVDDFTDEAVWAITKVGRGDLGIHFIKNFKHPAGYYESQVEAVRGALHTFRSHIHDNDVVYGPWLNGTGSRNYPVTRFRGYPWSVVAAALQQKAVPIAEGVLPPFLARMRGGAA